MAENPLDWEQETKLVRGGMARSPYGEISEPIYLTQSFAYESAASIPRGSSGRSRRGRGPPRCDRQPELGR